MITVEFKGQCKGIRLQQRGMNDLHISIQPLTEDDENWFETTNYWSSYWLDEAMDVMQQAKDWMQKNAEPDISEHDGSQYGYKFKTT